MNQMIKPIETRYAGCRFRSRIEARWAVLFDHLGIGWQYEPQGFELPSGPYLPDFLLDLSMRRDDAPSDIQNGVWFEVKGAEPTEYERRLCWELYLETRRHTYIAHGGIPRDGLEEPRIEHAVGAKVRWFIRPEVIGLVPEDWRFEQTGRNAQRLLSAYQVARSARFEHGESPLDGAA